MDRFGSRAVVGVLLGLVPALGACGDDGGEDSATVSTTMPATTAAATTTVSTGGGTDDPSSSTSGMTVTGGSSSSGSTSGSSVDSGGSSSDGGSTLTGFEILSYASDIEPIILENCGAGGICHQSELAPASGMLLSAGMGYARLVDVVSVQVPELNRVSPGMPGQSYLVNKIRGTSSSVGGAPSRMPVGGVLSDEQIFMFRAWIAGGAMP